MTTRRSPALAAVAAAAAIALLGGCAASSSGTSPGGGATGGGSGGGGSTTGPTTGPSTTPSRSLSPFPEVGATAGLRGVAVAAVDCSVQGSQPAGASSVLPATPRSIVLCPQELGNPSGGKTAPTTLTPAPPDLLAALATADTPRPTDSSYACAAYADLPQSVFAVLPDGSVRRLRIPEDGACRHYLMSVLRVLQQYR